MADLPFPFAGPLLKVTVSIGISTLSSDDDLPSLMHRADLAFYEAKKTGRNCSVKKAA